MKKAIFRKGAYILTFLMLILFAAALFKTAKNVNAAAGSVYVGTTKLTSGQSNSSGGGTLTFTETSDKATITLNNYKKSGSISGTDSISSGAAFMIYYTGSLPLEINVNGTNEITCTGTYTVSCAAIFPKNTNQTVTFTGEGSLTATGAQTSMPSYGYLGTNCSTTIFNGPTLTFNGGKSTNQAAHLLSSAGVRLDNNTFSVESGKVICRAGVVESNMGSYGLYSTATGNNDMNYVNGGSFEAYGDKYALYASKGLTVSKNAKYVILESPSYAINTNSLMPYIPGAGYKNGEQTLTITGSGGATGAASCDKIVLKQPLTVTSNAYSGAYDGASHTISLDVNAAGDYSVEYGLEDGVYDLTDIPTFTDVGVYTVYYKVSEEGGTPVTGSNTVTITKADFTVTSPTLCPGVYDGSEHTLCEALSIDGASKVLYKIGLTGEYSEELPTATLPGSYDIYCKYVGDDNHNTKENVGPYTVVIANASITNVTADVSDLELVYNGSDQSPTVSIDYDTVNNVEGSIYYSTSENGVYSSEMPSFVNAGIHTIYYKISVENHDDYFGSFNFEIKKAQMPDSIKVVVNDDSLVYNKNPQAPALTKYDTLPTNDEVVFTYSIAEDGEYTSVIPTNTNVGEYTIYVKASANGYYDKYSFVEYSIIKSDPKYTAPTAKTDLVYTSEGQELVNALVLGEGATGVMYRLGINGDYLEAIPTAIDANTYYVYYKVLGDSNYNDLEILTPVEVVIDKATIRNVQVIAQDTAYYDGNKKTTRAVRSYSSEGMALATFTYSATEDGQYTSAIPSFVKYGDHTIYYIISIPNHYDYHGSFVFTIENGTLPEELALKATDDILVYNKDFIAPNVLQVSSIPTGEIPTFTYSRAEDGEYSDVIPSYKDAGTYTIYYKIEADGYNSKLASFEYTINRADSYYDKLPEALDLYYTRDNQTLLNAGESECGDIMYSLSIDSAFDTVIPQMEDVGTYTIYFYIVGDNNHNDSIVSSIDVMIKENDKSSLNDKITEAEELYDKLKDKYQNVANVLNEAINEAKLDQAKKNILVEEIEATTQKLNEAILKAIDDSRDVIKDEESNVYVVTGDGSGIPVSVNLLVEVRAKIKAEKGTTEYSKISKLIGKNEKINGVYDVKLIKNVDGVESEVQPSDIHDGMTLIVHVQIPNGLKLNGLKLLHIHNENDMEFVENYEIIDDEIVFEVDRLSEIAFIEKIDSMPAWAIALIVILSVILLLVIIYLLLFFVFNKWINKDSKAVRVIKCGKKDNLVRLMSLSFRIEYREADKVYKSKDEALKEE